MPETVIRPLAAADHDDWQRLWAGYLRFYRADLPEAVTATTWARLLDPEGDVEGLVAARDGRVIGLCHYLFHATTWGPEPYCYLNDRYVDPAARGSGAARALILACEAVARERGAVRLYWATQEFNGPARSLYDTIVPRSSFIPYRKPLG